MLVGKRSIDVWPVRFLLRSTKDHVGPKSAKDPNNWYEARIQAVTESGFDEPVAQMKKLRRVDTDWHYKKHIAPVLAEAGVLEDLDRYRRDLQPSSGEEGVDGGGGSLVLKGLAPDSEDAGADEDKLHKVFPETVTVAISVKPPVHPRYPGKEFYKLKGDSSSSEGLDLSDGCLPDDDVKDQQVSEYVSHLAMVCSHRLESHLAAATALKEIYGLVVPRAEEELKMRAEDDFARRLRRWENEVHAKMIVTAATQGAFLGTIKELAAQGDLNAKKWLFEQERKQLGESMVTMHEEHVGTGSYG